MKLDDGIGKNIKKKNIKNLSDFTSRNCFWLKGILAVLYGLHTLKFTESHISGQSKDFFAHVVSWFILSASEAQYG